MGWIESQIETRSKLDAELVDRAYAQLAASVVDPRQAPRITFSDIEQADGAAKACLVYCGVEPGPVPQDETELDRRLEYLCRPSGAMYRTVRLDGKWYKRAFGALLGHLDTGEAVALLPRGSNGYKMFDPSTGHALRVTAEVAKRIEPEAVFFYRPLPPRRLTTRDLIAFIVSVFDRSDYALVFFAALAATIAGLLPAWANSIAFGVVIPSGHANLIAPIAGLLVGVAVSTVLINACRNLIMQRLSLKIDVSTEAATFARVLSLPTNFFKQYSSGNLGSRISQVPILTQQMTSIMLGSGLTSLLSLVYLFQIGLYAHDLALPAFIVIIAQAACTVFTTVVFARYERRILQSSASLSGTVTALLNGIQKIKLAGAEDRAFAKWAKDYAAYARNAYNYPPLIRATPTLVGIIGMVGTIVIYYYAGLSQVSVADYMAFNVAYGQMTAAIMALATAAGEFAQVRPLIEMVSPILEAEPEISDNKPSVEGLTGAITVNSVSFRYGEESPYVLNNLSFTIRPGEYVALVGKSGCGKSTILRLLLGFEKPERGSIFYGAYDVTKVDLRSLRSAIGTVLQDGRLFMATIAANITVSSPSATLDDAWNAAELAGIAEDIRKMPMGMQTIVTEGGGGLSGGQKQRIMIARAICGSRKILMFDEATSALDNVTQKHVSDALDSLNCTRLVVAHRLSTVKHCDRILVVDSGRIAEEGTYDELIAKGGLFAELVARQRIEGE